jgi:hypothetical protein
MTFFIPATIRTFIPSSQQLQAVFRTAARRDYGPDLERIARSLAIAIAFTYACGYAFGCWLHQTNDKLARRTVLVVSEPRTGDPQPATPFTSDPQPTQRTTRSKLPKPAPKPSRKRSAKAAAHTGLKPAAA